MLRKLVRRVAVLCGALAVPFSMAHSATSFPYAKAGYTCGPTDAIVFAFDFATSPLEQERFPAAVLSIEIDSHNVTAQRYFVGQKNPSVAVLRCLDRPDHCDEATSGFLHLAEFNAKGTISGDYEFHFKNGGIEKGSFHVTGSNERLLCG